MDSSLITPNRHDMTPVEEQDEWVFDTVKPATMIKPDRHTSKRRKMARIPSYEQRSCEDMMESMDLNAAPLGTMTPSPRVNKVRKVSSVRRSSVLTAQRVPSNSTPTARRVSRGEQLSKKPLGVDLSFGNSPSTVRQFRRVSGEKENHSHASRERRLNRTRSKSAINLSYSSVDTLVNDDECQKDDEMQSASQPPSATSKEALLGRRAFSKIIDGAFQETYAQTATPTKREAISHVANAWSNLNNVDPEGEFLLLKMMLERVSGDMKLATALGIQFTPQSPVKNTPAPAPAVKEIPGNTGTPDSPTRQKLILSQNNPHLKSHRRRQSAFVVGTSGGIGFERERSAWTGIDDRKLPGHVTPGMEHGGLLADVLYGRWLEGLKSRWPLS